jgi:hypothetical protein
MMLPVLKNRFRKFGYFGLMAFFGVLSFILSVLDSGDAAAEDWLRFRGTTGTGVAPEGTSTPTKFSATQNVKWKEAIPGAGASSPIIVGDKVILTCYTGYGQDRDDIGEMDQLKRHVICYSKSDGSKLWQKDFDPHLPEDEFRGMGVPEHGYASSTPASDGTNVYVFFGKSGVVAMDLDGNELWKANVGTGSGDKRWGSGGSPVIAGGTVVINATDESNSVIGLDKDTGKELWRNEGITNVWGTPLAVGTGDDQSVVISVPKEVWAMDPATGKLDWYSTNGVADSSVSASPVLNGDNVIVMGGRSGTGVALKLGGTKGADVTETHTVWKGKAVARIMTPVVYDGLMFGISRGVVTCADAATGEEVYKERLPSEALGGGGGGRRGPSSDYSSPVVSGGNIYQVLKNGTILVIAAKREFELVSVNKFEDDGTEFNSTPAFSDNQMFIRSNKFLYCIGE